MNGRPVLLIQMCMCVPNRQRSTQGITGLLVGEGVGVWAKQRLLLLFREQNKSSNFSKGVLLCEEY